MADPLPAASDAQPDPAVAATQTPTTAAPDVQVTSPETTVADAWADGEAWADGDGEPAAGRGVAFAGEGDGPADCAARPGWAPGCAGAPGLATDTRPPWAGDGDARPVTAVGLLTPSGPPPEEADGSATPPAPEPASARWPEVPDRPPGPIDATTTAPTATATAPTHATTFSREPRLTVRKPSRS